MATPTLEARARGIRRVLWFTLAGNLVVAGLKLGYAFLSGAVSLEADGLHAVLDGSSNVIALLGMHFAAAPPDARYPYGHRKIETLATLAIAGSLTLGLLK